MSLQQGAQYVACDSQEQRCLHLVAAAMLIRFGDNQALQVIEQGRTRLGERAS